MTAINLPGQLELATVVDHKKERVLYYTGVDHTKDQTGVQIAKLLRQYEDRPTSETWSRIQALAKEILK